VSCAKTGRQISTIYTSYDVFLHKVVPFLGPGEAVPHLGGEIPKKTIFGEGIGNFEPNATKFCTVMNTTKYCSWVVQTCIQQMQDGRQLPFWEKIAICQQRFDSFSFNLARRHILIISSLGTVKILTLKIPR